MFKNIFSNAPKGSCSCCHKVFKDSQLLEYDGLPFCKKHHQSILSGNIILFKEEMISPDEPDKSVAVHEEQLNFFKKNITSYLKITYKEHNNKVYSIVSLYILKS